MTPFVVTALSALLVTPAPAYPRALSSSSTAMLQQAGVSSPAATAQAAAEVITEIRIHGNDATPDADIIKLAGVTIGAPFGATTVADIAAKLRDAHRFQRVEVLKRYASISDPTQVVIVIVVDEGPISISIPQDRLAPPKVTRRGWLSQVLVAPILDAEDGYGVAYGARFAFVEPGASAGRLSFPLTWGGEKRAAAEYERYFANAFVTRIETGVEVKRVTNPFFQADDTRRDVWGRAERAAGHLRAGTTIGWQHVSFAGTTDSFRSIGADVTFDTRLDPFLARNAVYLNGTWDRLTFASGPTVARSQYEARGYLGLIGQNILVVRVMHQDADAPLPAYLKSLLGGVTNLRGFDAGTEAGDTLAAGSIEIRMPLSSPMSLGKLGVSVFADTGTAYNKGQTFDDRALKTGIGGAVWFTATVVHLSLSVAHGINAGTRVQFGGGISY